ncbi:TrmB family transcriptional regulator [Candidatus Parcubacteria bacterium]|nr:TrmB family transcriptional regulator [Candidatus Parcubacteria bacterium]
MEVIPILKQLGFSDKEIKIYLVLLEQGPSSVRTLASFSKINRGTTYDILKSLKEGGLVSYYHKDTKQFFVAENPAALQKTLAQKIENLESVKKELTDAIPELTSLFNKSPDKPVVKYYEGFAGLKAVLSDVLEITESSKEKNYSVFSSEAIREYIYKAFPDFTKQRIKRKIRIKSIGIGHKGSVAELAEKKSLSVKKSSPTYILIYPGKVAMVSATKSKQPLALIIEDEALFATQQQLFNFIWESL